MSKRIIRTRAPLALVAALVFVAAVPAVSKAQAIAGSTWYVEILLDLGPDGLPYTEDDTLLPAHLQFHPDRTFTLSSIAEIGVSGFLPGIYTTMQGVWRPAATNTIELVGIALQTASGTTTTIRAVGRIRIDSPTEAAVTSALVEFLAPCTGNLTCSDPTQDVPAVPPDAPFDLGTMRRLTLAH